MAGHGAARHRCAVKTVRLDVAVSCDDDVTPAMVRDIVLNHLWWALADTHGGRIDWKKTLRIRALHDLIDQPTISPH